MITIAREYLRVSKGKGRTARSIRDQHTENLAAEADFGPWTWGEAYKDTGSASKYARKVRDDFEKMMSDLKTGAFGKPGDVLVLWEISRLARETGRGVALIDACEAGGYLIHITSHERTYNPANYQDRHSLISGIADAEKEARLLSVRTLRGINSAARQGRPHGPCHFGYKRDYELIDGKPRPVRQYEHPHEGPLVRELFKRVGGTEASVPESIYAVAKDWKARGVVSRGGVPFSPQSLRTMLLHPAYAGLRSNHGKLIPTAWDGWDPLVSRETWDRVQKLLADPSRRTYTGEGIKHVLTMTIRCDTCGGPLVVSLRRGKGSAGYECQFRGCARVNKAETDALLIGDATQPGVILSYLARPDVYEALETGDAGDDEGEEVRQVRADLAGARGDLMELEDAKPKNLAEARTIARAIETAEAEVARLEKRERALVRPNPLSELFPPGPAEDVAARWEATPLARRRAIAALLLQPGVLGQVRVTPSPDRYRQVPAVDRIVFRKTPLAGLS